MLFDAADENKPRIVVCAGTACQASGSNVIVRAAKRHIIEKGLVGKVALAITGCHGFCEMGPFVLTEPQQAFYAQVGFDDIPRIIDALLSGEYVEELLYKDPATGQRYYKRDDIPFFKNQRRSILSLNQKIDPIRVFDYIAQGGYIALESVLSQRDPHGVVQEVKRSGLRGRGGGGFPTGAKWEMLARESGRGGKFLVCNADEGDPGAYMDRSILEGNPHSIIEGMLIGAYGTGASQGIVYVRAEYPVAVKHLNIALEQARRLGLLGEHVLGTDFSFDMTMVKGAGAFVCGEETALIRSIQGKMGEPRQRPPFPVQKGIEGKPTSINNVETWANVPLIFRLGADKFAQVGTENNAGTKIFSLVGKVKNTGLVEVPMGTRIKEIVYEIGGGAVGKARIKAIQTGGPSGGCIPSDMFDLPVDYDSLAKAGSIMGSGGMIVMDDNTCMVDVARYFMNFLKEESCGKCFTCRKGTQRMHEILEDISRGKATLKHLDLLQELAEVVKDTTMCGLGQTASNPVLSTLRYFRHEYERHVIDKKCDAFVCKDLVGAPCQAACPLGTEAWRYVALIEKGEYVEAYKVIREANPFPSVCARVCDRKCETRCSHAVSGGEAIAVRSLKRFVTDSVAPEVYVAPRIHVNGGASSVAVVGAGPAGLAAAHYLSLYGHKVTLIEAEKEPGGMLMSCIPSYRLPREVLRKEIQSLLDPSITVRCGTAFGRDITVDELFKDVFKAVFLAIGADKSYRLELEGEDVKGVYSSMQMLKAFNLRGDEVARGRVGIIGGGNSAVDAARVAIRQKGVDNVTLLYRRTSQEMPAYAEEIEAALEEGIALETLVSPVKIRYMEAARSEGVRVETFVSPIKIDTRHGHLADIRCIRNSLGEVDASGRRRPVPIPGSEFTIPLDTLIVAIGERPDSDCLAPMGLEMTKSGTLRVNAETLAASRPGVFAGGDLVTGPNTVVDAIAAGKKAAYMIDRYVRGKELKGLPETKMPKFFMDPPAVSDADAEEAVRAEPVTLPAASRRKNTAEVEMALSAEAAIREARRCLRCDLDFTRPREDSENACSVKGKSA
ncbi:MAG: FAD-dependent oxidoreductase [Phycisphaerae bacterium]|nr:FAD-dependent oxidoreductase [Phycisphaerae bacterium]